MEEPGTGQPIGVIAPVESEDLAVPLPTFPPNGTFPSAGSSSSQPVIPSALLSDISSIITSDVLGDIATPTSLPVGDIASDVSALPSFSFPVLSNIPGNDPAIPTAVPEVPVPTDSVPTPIFSLQPIESSITDPDEDGLNGGDDSQNLDELRPPPGTEEPGDNGENEDDTSDDRVETGGEDTFEEGSDGSEVDPPSTEETQSGSASQVSSNPSPTSTLFRDGIDPGVLASILSGSVTLQTSIILPTGAVGAEGPASGGLAPLPTGVDDEDDDNSAVRLAGRGYAMVVGLLVAFITAFVC